MAELLTSTQVCERFGISYRQLYYWIQKGYIDSPPRSGSGNPLLWLPSEVDRVGQVHDALTEIYRIADEAGLTLFDRGPRSHRKGKSWK